MRTYLLAATALSIFVGTSFAYASTALPTECAVVFKQIDDTTLEPTALLANRGRSYEGMDCPALAKEVGVTVGERFTPRENYRDRIRTEITGPYLAMAIYQTGPYPPIEGGDYDPSFSLDYYSAWNVDASGTRIEVEEEEKPVVNKQPREGLPSPTQKSSVRSEDYEERVELEAYDPEVTRTTSAYERADLRRAEREEVGEEAAQDTFTEVHEDVQPVDAPLLKRFWIRTITWFSSIF